MTSRYWKSYARQPRFKRICPAARLLGLALMVSGCADTGDLFRTAYDAENRGDLASAERGYRQYLDADSEPALRTSRLFNIARVQARQGKYAEAAGTISAIRSGELSRYLTAFVNSDVYVAALIGTNNLDEAFNVANRNIAQCHNESGSTWRIGDAILDGTNLRSTCVYYVGLRTHRGGSLANLRRYGQVYGIRIRPLYDRCNNGPVESWGVCTAGVELEAEQILMREGLNEFAAWYAQEAAAKIRTATAMDEQRARDAQLQADIANRERIFGAVVGIAAAGLTAAAVARAAAPSRSPPTSSYVPQAAPTPATAPSPSQGQRGLPQGQQSATSGQSVSQAPAASRAAVPGVPGRTVSPSPQPPPRVAIPAPPPAVPRFRHWLNSNGASHNVYVANDGSAAIQCRVTLNYSQMVGERTQHQVHSGNISVSPGQSNYTGVTGTSGISGAYLTPGSYNVNCR